MDALEDILKSGAYPGTFHPIYQRSPSAWFPGNEAASLLLQSQFIWDDIVALSNIQHDSNGQYQRKLILKYLIVELRSLLEVFDRLQALVMRATVFDPEERDQRPYRGITMAEHRLARALYKEYAQAKSGVEKDVVDIRNAIGAHRGNIDWPVVMRFWDALSLSALQPLLDVIPRVFAHVKELNIYEWSRAPNEGVIEIIGAAIYSGDIEFEDVLDSEPP